jgi:phenylacetate-CoA ligase
MAIHRFADLVRFVRAHSPYYRALYAALPDDEERLEALPVVSQRELWEAHVMTGGENRLLTGPLRDGFVFKSGGTTGNPKLSVYLQEEWETLCGTFGAGIAAGGLTPGERIGNLFYVGDLYASFLFIQRALERSPIPVVQFPISGAAPLESIVHTLLELDITTIVATPTSALRIAEPLAEAARINGPRSGQPPLRKLLFGGEAVYPDQRARLLELFPGLDIRSIGCASVDAGLLGYVDDSCVDQEHRVFGAETIVEVIDDDHDVPITEVGRGGRLVVTNLTRRLMPILRYPCGDRAEWAELAGPRDRKFRLLGRSEESARVGPISIYFDDIRLLLEPFQQRLGVLGHQLHVLHVDRKDRLRLVIAVRDPHAVPSAAAGHVLAELHARRPMLRDGEAKGTVHPTCIDWVVAAGLAVHPRTGKLRRIVDERR